MKQEVAVIGVGQTTFTRDCGMSIRELCFEAYKDAALGLNLDPKDVDASILASAPEYDKQRTPAALVSEYLGFPPSPTFYLETVCSSGTTGVRVGYSLIKSGLHDIVVMEIFLAISEMQLQIFIGDGNQRQCKLADNIGVKITHFHFRRRNDGRLIFQYQETVVERRLPRSKRQYVRHAGMCMGQG